MTPPVRMHDLEGDEGPGEGPALFEAVVEDRISHPADRPEEGDARMPGLIKIARSRSRTRIDAGNYRTIVSSNEFSLSLSLSLSLSAKQTRDLITARIIRESRVANDRLLDNTQRYYVIGRRSLRLPLIPLRWHRRADLSVTIASMGLRARIHTECIRERATCQSQSGRMA